MVSIKYFLSGLLVDVWSMSSPAFHIYISRENILCMSYSSYEDIIPEPTFKTLFKLNWFLKVLASKHSSTWVWPSTYNICWEEDTNKSIKVISGFCFSAMTSLPCFAWSLYSFISCRYNACLGYLTQHCYLHPTSFLCIPFALSDVSIFDTLFSSSQLVSCMDPKDKDFPHALA